MKTWSVKTRNSLVEITAYQVTIDLLVKGGRVIWADGIRIAFDSPVIYVEEI